MSQLNGLGYLPDLPKTEDYDEQHPKIAALLQKTRLGHRVAGTMKSVSTGGGIAAAAAPAAIAQVDLRQWFSPIENQGALGSCTANAAAGLLEYFERRANNRYVDASRLFLYKAERNLLGWTGDTGAYLRTAMGALVLFGAPPEQYWPYNIANFDVEPSAFCYAFASNFQGLQYFRLDPVGTSPVQALANIKAYLAAGFPSMFGFPVYPEYDHPLPGSLVAYPAPNSHSRGGHANIVAGYDDNMMIGADKGALLIRNSWGNGWANGGYAWMSYKYVTQGLANDWWSLISAEWVNTAVF
ncbi:MAG TPA: C1 family peptidase [Terriglobia bacterium]|nr:C1 family peptidase [Terriglobia bacterium]